MPPDAERRLFWVTGGGVLLLDLATKLLAEDRLLRAIAVPVLGEWFQLRLVYNPGAAFGLHLGPFSRWIFLGVAVLAVIVLARMSVTAPVAGRGRDRARQVALGAVAGGAAGNLVDRIRSPRGVVDFFDVGLGALRWPTFNVADVAVSCGAIALALVLWREDARRGAASESAPAA